MRRLLVVLGVLILCLPLLVVGWIVVAVRWQKMDPVTMQAPDGLRRAVAEAVVERAGWGKAARTQLERATRLDPDDTEGWNRRCAIFIGSGDAKADVETCVRAVELGASEANLNALGRARERAGDECGAEDAFTKASSRTSGNAYGHVENMGKAALRCGDLYGARAGLETAVELQDKNLKEPDQEQDDIDETKGDQTEDREYLIVTFDRLHEAKLAAETCSVAHPQWARCDCTLDAKGVVKCAEARR